MFKKSSSAADHSDSSFVMSREEPRPVKHASGTSTSKIGTSVTIIGELIGAEPMTFDGRIEGRVDFTGQTLVIGAQGMVKGEIHAGVVRVEGHVEGDISASEQIIVTASGTVYGDMVAPRLSLEDGATLKGSIYTNPMSRVNREQTGSSAREALPVKTDSFDASSTDALGAFSDDEHYEPHVIHS